MQTGAWAFQRQRTIDSLVGSPSALSKPAASRALAQSTGTAISQHLPRSRTGSSILNTLPFYIDNHRWDLGHSQHRHLSINCGLDQLEEEHFERAQRGGRVPVW